MCCACYSKKDRTPVVTQMGSQTCTIPAASMPFHFFLISIVFRNRLVLIGTSSEAVAPLLFSFDAGELVGLRLANPGLGPTGHRDFQWSLVPLQEEGGRLPMEGKATVTEHGIRSCIYRHGLNC